MGDQTNAAAIRCAATQVIGFYPRPSPKQIAAYAAELVIEFDRILNEAPTPTPDGQETE